MNRAEYIFTLFTEISYHNKKIESMSKSNKRNILIALRDRKMLKLRQMTDVNFNQPKYKQEETIL